MELKRIEDRLSRLTSMVDGWKREGGFSRIERDMALEELRRLYDDVLDCEPQTEPKVAIVVPTVERVETPAVEENEEQSEESAEESVEDSHSDVGDAFDDALDIDAILGITADDIAPEPAPEPTPEPAPEPAPEPTPEPKIGGGLFDIEDIPVRTKSGRKMIALYNTPTTPAEPIAEEVVPEYVAEPAAVAPETATETAAETPSEPVRPAEPAAAEAPKRLADVLGSGVKVLGDKMAAEETATPQFNRISDLRKAIGLNDKFLMIRDLFGGDAARYEDTIDTLNEFDDLDECMIYIVENFRWNPDSEGAKLLVSLLERKLA